MRGRPKKLNKIVVEGEIAKILLQDGRVAIIDAADVALVQNHTWHSFKSEAGNWYARTKIPAGNEKSKLLWLHRLVSHAPEKMVVNHRDHDGLNNRQGNLRCCTQAQNLLNRRKRKSASEYRGVYPKGKRFAARLRIGQKFLYLGTFDTELEAARAYDAANSKLRDNDFAPSNFSI